MEFTIYKPEGLRLQHTMQVLQGSLLMTQTIYYPVYTRVTVVANNEAIIVAIAL